METSIATVCLSGDLREKIKAIARADFDGVGIFENDFLILDKSPREMGDMARDHGLEITAQAHKTGVYAEALGSGVGQLHGDDGGRIERLLTDPANALF